MNIKKSHPRRALIIIWSLCAFVVITAALFITAARILIPLLNDHRVEIEDYIQQELGEKVTIGTISADWSGFQPSIRLNDVSLYKEGRTNAWLEFSAVEVSINVFSSVREGELEPSKIAIQGVGLSVVREGGNLYQINGQQIDIDAEEMWGRDRFLAWFFSRDHISIQDADVEYVDARNRNKHLAILDAGFVIENGNGFHHIRGELNLPDKADHKISYVINLSGDYKHPDTLESEFYLEGDVTLGAWLQNWGLTDKQILGGNLQFNVWGTSSNSNIQGIQANLKASDLAWGLPVSITEKNVSRIISDYKKIAGQFFWNREQDGWRFTAEQFEIARGEKVWPASDFSIKYDDKEKSLLGNFSFLRLQDVFGFVVSLDLLSPDQDINVLLDESKTRGDISNLKFHVQGPLPEIERYFVSANIQGLSFDGYKEIPGIKGIDGKLIANNEAGFLTLDSHMAVADFGKLFRSTIGANSLSGDVYWRRSVDGWRIESHDLSAGNYHISTRSRLQVDLFDDGRSPFLDLQVSFVNGDISQARHYLPTDIMDSTVVDWLDRALESGDLRTGVMVLHGHAADFPFDKGTGIFDVRFNVENMLFNYSEGWPRAEEFSADVVFRGRSLKIDVVGGKIFDMDIKPGRIAITDMTNNATVIMDSDFAGQTSEMLRLLETIPVGDDYSGFLRGVKSTGESTLALDLRLPLENPGKHQVNGVLDFSDCTLLLADRDVEFTGINGAFQFKFRKGKYQFEAKDIRSRFRNSDAIVSVGTHDSEAGQEISIDIRTNMTATTLFGKSAAFMSDYFSGTTEWLASINIEDSGSSEKNNVELAISSSLSGIALDLPAGFGKKKTESRNLIIVLVLSEKNTIPVKIEYGDYARGSLRLFVREQGYELDKGTLMLGGALAFRGEEKGLSIRGSIPRLSVSDWVSWEERTKKQGTTRYISQLVSMAELELGELEFYDSIFHGIKLKANKQETSWNVVVDGKELKGNFRVPDDFSGDNSIVLDLSRLYLNIKESDTKVTLFDPRKLPQFHITSEEFQYNGMSLGSLSLQTRRTDAGMYIESLNTTTDNLELNASGWWTRDNSQHVSSFNINLSSDDVGKALDILNFEGAVSGGSADIDMHVNWVGPPNWFEMKRLNGEMALRLLDGQLLEVEPGGGRVFGILSVQALPRRLSLDFSDLFKKGFSFDKIEGNFTMSEGNAYTNDLYLDGPAAQIDISGRVGLAEKDYDQSVVVTPHFSSSIPIVGGIAAANPGVGIGLWIADKLFGKEINKITRSRYEITGSWEDPQVTRQTIKPSSSTLEE